MRSGDCCTQPDEVVMTTQERAVLEAVVPEGTALKWSTTPDSRFVSLKAGPCPLLARDARGSTFCTVYAARPYACRRWGCFRDDCSQPVDLSPVPLHVLKDRNLRRQYARMQARAMPWALAHGWDRSMDGR